MGKLTISMAIFNSKLLNDQRLVFFLLLNGIQMGLWAAMGYLNINSNGKKIWDLNLKNGTVVEP